MVWHNAQDIVKYLQLIFNMLASQPSLAHNLCFNASEPSDLYSRYELLIQTRCHNAFCHALTVHAPSCAFCVKTLQLGQVPRINSQAKGIDAPIHIHTLQNQVQHQQHRAGRCPIAGYS